MQLRVDTSGSPATNPEDALITDLVSTATQLLDAGTGPLGRALAPQTWRLSLPTFLNCYIRLPYPPLIDIVSFTYVNDAGSTIALIEGTDYRVIAETGVNAGIAQLAPIYQGSWPTARYDFDSVQITYRCGYGAGSPLSETTPDAIKHAVKRLITVGYDNRDDAHGAMQDALHQVMTSLVGFRVWGDAP